MLFSVPGGSSRPSLPATENRSRLVGMPELTMATSGSIELPASIQHSNHVTDFKPAKDTTREISSSAA